MYKDKERAKLNGVYRWAKARCTNPNVKQFKDYGGRGIEFRFKSFEEFLLELGPRPPGLMLDRINNDGHYEPGNVRWATRQEQNNNKGLYDTNKTGISGLIVRQYSYGSVYVLRRCVDGKRIHLYQGTSLEAALRINKEWNEKIRLV